MVKRIGEEIEDGERIKKMRKLAERYFGESESIQSNEEEEQMAELDSEELEEWFQKLNKSNYNIEYIVIDDDEPVVDEEYIVINDDDDDENDDDENDAGLHFVMVEDVNYPVYESDEGYETDPDQIDNEIIFDGEED